MNYRLFCKSLTRVLISTFRSQTVDKALYNSCIQLVKPDVSDCFVGTLSKLSGTCQRRASQIVICVFFKPLLRKGFKFYLMYQNANTLCSQLSWSHYRILMRISDDKRRAWYTEECAKSGWSVRQLERQINTMFYERLLSSKEKDAVAAEIQTTEPKPEYEKIIRDPYVLEFLDLPENPHFYEKNLEQAIIDHLQKFLLELGRGFSFVARQKKISFDGRHFYIDLVFYNYILKCFVLIDLKLGDLTHQDLGQMQMYVNYYTRELMNEGDNPPIGIVLCADKSDAIVKYTISENDTQIFASKYMTYIPSEEEFKRELRLDDYKKKDDLQE